MGKLASTALGLGLLVGACDGGGTPPASAAPADDAKAKAEAEALAERKAEREAKAKAEADAKAAHAAKIEALAVLPESPPKTLDKACEAMTKAYDAFMRTVLKGDDLVKWETGGNEMQLKLFSRQCHQRAPEVAACQANALSQMTPDMDKDLPDVMQRCADKFARDPPKGN